MKPLRRKSYGAAGGTYTAPPISNQPMPNIQELQQSINKLTQVIEEVSQKEQLLDQLNELKQQAKDAESRYQQKLQEFES